MTDGSLRLRERHPLRFVWAFVIAMLFVPPTAARASVTAPDEKPASIRVSDKRVTAPKGADRGASLWTWSKGRRAYGLFTGASPGNLQTFNHIGAVDLDTGEVVDSERLPAGQFAWAGHSTTLYWSRGMPHTGAVDEEEGKVFVAYGPSSIADTPAQTVAGTGCPSPGHSVVKWNCMAGYHVIDGRTLDVLGQLQLDMIAIDGLAPIVIPRATTVVRRGGKTKLLALVMDISRDNLVSKGEYNAGSFETDRVFLVQWDVEGRRQEWSLGLRECRSARESHPQIATYGQRRPNPAVIVAADDGVWVGCTSDYAQAGAMVWVPVDAEGAPRGVTAPFVRAQETPVSPPTLDEARGLAISVDDIQVYRGPERVVEFWADAMSQRILMRVLQENPSGEVWYVFDGKQRTYLGVIGTGKNGMYDGSVGMDATSGRFYVLHPEGLYVADIRRTPLGQALLFPIEGLSLFTGAGWPLALDSDSEDAARRVLAPIGDSTAASYGVIEDNLPVSADAVLRLSGRMSLDLDEQEGVTVSTYDGTARGYGARVLLMGGVDAATRWRFVDGLGTIRAVYDYLKDPGDGTDENPGGPLKREAKTLGLPSRDPCLDQDREVVLGFVGPSGPAVVDSAGSRGTAVPLVLDGTTAVDLERPVSRCTRQDWEAIWERALFGTAPSDEPGVPAGLRPAEAQCLQGDEASEVANNKSTSGDASGPFYAQTRCQSDEAGGFSYARGGAPGATVGEAISSFRIYRDPGRGIVSRVESVARGVDVAGALRIQSVRGIAESWANGRQQPVQQTDRPADYDANCDFERSAGTCFQRHVFGVWTPGYSCGPCGDEASFIAGLNAAMRSDLHVAFRKADGHLARGAEDGTIAAVTKPQGERFADLTLNGDTLQTVVPTLQVVHYAAPFRTLKATRYGPNHGRQIYQFAGVEVSSSYGIQCLLVYDEETNTCAAEQLPPAALTVELTDTDGEPLAGGAFEIRRDSDADGLAGLADELVPDGACVTADDGIGTCQFPALQPGDYTVTQVAAPPGYAAVTEPYAVQLIEMEQRTVTFSNASNQATITVTATDEQGGPLEGAEFAAYPDPDADGKIASDTEPAARCTTGADGTCTMIVPLGAYVLVQTSAPAGLEGIEPIAFALAQGGATAAVTVSNYPAGVPAAAAAPGPVAYQEPAAPLPRLRVVPLPVAGIPMDDQSDAPTFSPRDTVVQIVRAPGDVLRLLGRNPQEAAAFAATLLLMAMAVGSLQRRRRCAELIGPPAG